MGKRAVMSNVHDPENRSKKNCVCGGHSKKAKKKRKKWKREITAEDLLEETRRIHVDTQERGRP